MALRALLASLALLCGMLGAGAAQAALACSATMSDINFGSVSLRAGVSNQTSGNLRIDCAGAGLGVVAVGACIAFGPGSGGAGLSPRRMRRADAAALDYELRAGGNGAIHGTWTTAFVVVLIGLGGGGGANVPVFADITSTGTATGTGLYQSTFTGAANGSLTYGVALCGGFGTTVAIPGFAVSATVASSCEADSAALNFGNVGSVIASHVDASAVLNVRCTSATPYAVRLGNGSGPGATGPERRVMTSLLGQMVYGLYQDAARTSPWGDQPGTDLDATGSGGNQGFTIYGRIFAGQAVPVGLYTDSVIVTIEY